MKKYLKMTPFTTPFVFGGLLIRTILETAGLKKMASRLNWLEEILEEDFKRGDDKDEGRWSGWLGMLFYKVGIMTLLIVVAIFTEIYYAFNNSRFSSKKSL